MLIKDVRDEKDHISNCDKLFSEIRKKPKTVTAFKALKKMSENAVKG